MKFIFEVIIQRPVDKVFEFLWTLDERDFSNNLVVPVYERITKGPRKVGSIIREVIQASFFRMEIFSEITRVVPNKCLEYKFWSDSIRGELVYNFEDIGEGTRLMQRVNTGFIGVRRIATPLLLVFYKPRVQKRLESIKDLLEKEYQEKTS